MTSEDTLLLRNLLERLDADASAERPVLRSHFSDREREALRSLLAHVEDARPAAATERDAEQATKVVGTSAPELNLTALQLDAPPDPKWTLCLDFGTAKSKAFAASDDPLRLLPLAIGQADNDLDGAVHDVSSSLWIEDNGLVFVGSEAVTRGQYNDSRTRRRLDSLKQEISKVDVRDGAESAQRKLPLEVDPTETLSYADAITVYLAYLTDLATTALEERSLSRYVGRRFTVPWWPTEQRRWVGDLLSTALGRAQLLADTFHGSWREGIHVERVARAVSLAANYDAEMGWIQLDQSREGILEPLAAASSRLWTDRTARDVMLVVDVGAGTTDISLFLVAQKDGQFHRAWPSSPGGIAIRQAGDRLDELLVAEILTRAELGEDPDEKQRVSRGLNRDKRRLKETLFKTGEATARLVNDDTVTITEQEFMSLDGTRRFEELIVGRIQGFLDEVHESWARAVTDRITLVLTGGGCELPMIRDLENKSWTLGGREVRCRLAPEVPDLEGFGFTDEFVREYPRLAVAMGGALRMLLSEKEALREFMGGTPAPGPLDSFATRGE